ncbi:MAG: hypothetical protein WC401_10335 [Bacteroidales bacterium]
MEDKIVKARPLLADEVELRVSNITKDHSKCQLLIYKDARTDMALLDEIYPNQWQAIYQEIKGNLFCGIGVKIGDEWIWRWNCGVESKGTGDDDENNKKGEASDAFKRAGFLWGIGRELYQWKNISIKLSKDDFWVINQGQPGEKWILTTKFSVTKLDYTEKGAPLYMTIADEDMRVRFEYGKKVAAPKSEEGVEQTKRPATAIIKPNPINSDTIDIKVVGEPISVATEESITQTNKEIYNELVNNAYNMIFMAKIPNADTMAKRIIKHYFQTILKIPFSTIELSNNAEQKAPSIKGKIVVIKDEIWFGKNNYSSLQREVEQEINIFEMEAGNTK